MNKERCLWRLTRMFSIAAAFLLLGSTYGRGDYFSLCNDTAADSAERLSACIRCIELMRPQAKREGPIFHRLHACYFSRSWLYQEKFDYDSAIQDYNAAIKSMEKLDPKDHNALWRYHYLRALAYEGKNQFDPAVSDFTKALSFKSGTADKAMIYSSRADAWRNERNFDRALADNDKAISLEPTTRYYTERGETRRLQGDLDRALADHDEAIRINTITDVAFARLMRADTLRYRGEVVRALGDYDESLRLLPHFISALTGRGLTYEKMGDLAHARADFNEAEARGLEKPKEIAEEPNKSSFDTARARLAALDSGALQPIIPPAPGKAETPNAVPTPAITIPTVPPGSAAPEGRRVALIIGNSNYAIGRLPNPQHDAEAISDVLKRVGFANVTLVKDASRETLVNALRAFADEAEKSEWAVVYYAGHGIEIGGVNYILPTDVKLATDRDVQFEAIQLDQVLASIEQAKKLRLVFLDACRDNPFVANMRRTASAEPIALGATGGQSIGTRSVGRGLGRIDLSPQGGVMVFYAAKDGHTALDGEGENSPFAIALAQRLATPGVEINKLLRLVRDDVMEATAGRQEPYTYGSLPGREDFFFVER
jgi:tetratricopeptide (TPR) repeat protein